MTGYDKLWQDATREERQQVIDTYNKYYNTEKEPMSFEDLNTEWQGARFYTIKYTFGVVPF